MKKVWISLLIISFITSCVKQNLSDQEAIKEQTGNGSAKKNNINTINICHRAKGTWEIKNINSNAWPAFKDQGDIRLDDQDGDGFVPNNQCGFGLQGDCDDNNAFIHPGVAEICNGIDDNCNGVIDENCYPAVIIGQQVWMTRNLEVISYRNSDPINDVQSPWGSPKTGAWCYYANEPANGPIYGKLYNWYAVHDPRGLAPTGWHVPSEAEWNILTRTIDPATDTTNTSSIYSFLAGGALKETGLAHWLNPNTGATNSSGFTALPGGWRDDEGTFSVLTTHGMWWSSSGQATSGDGSPGYARGRFMNYSNTTITVINQPALYGLSVRCVRN